MRLLQSLYAIFIKYFSKLNVLNQIEDKSEIVRNIDYKLQNLKYVTQFLSDFTLAARYGRVLPS